MKVRTVEDIEARVAEIKAVDYDDERAHGMEDDLRHDVLRRIAAGDMSGSACARLAKAALKTTRISFARHCA